MCRCMLLTINTKPIFIIEKKQKDREFGKSLRISVSILDKVEMPSSLRCEASI